MDNISEKYATAIAEKFNQELPKGVDEIVIEVERGGKYDRIVKAQHYSRSVHAFIERSTGMLIKAAGWKAPAKNSGHLAYRYDLSTDEGFAHAVECADPFGSYLYAR